MDPLDLKSVYELVEGLSLQAEITNEIYANIYCSGCGSELENDQPYVTKEEVQEWYEDNVDVVVKTFDISQSNGEEFISYLNLNPMLGLNHPVGKKIFEKIRNRQMAGISYIRAGESFYRGRVRNNIERKAPFINEEMWNPPKGFPAQGR